MTEKVKILIVPSWIKSSLEVHGKTLQDALDPKIMSSILSRRDWGIYSALNTWSMPAVMESLFGEEASKVFAQEMKQGPDNPYNDPLANWEEEFLDSAHTSEFGGRKNLISILTDTNADNAVLVAEDAIGDVIVCCPGGHYSTEEDHPCESPWHLTMESILRKVNDNTTIDMERTALFTCYVKPS